MPAKVPGTQDVSSRHLANWTNYIAGGCFSSGFRPFLILSSRSGFQARPSLHLSSFPGADNLPAPWWNGLKAPVGRGDREAAGSKLQGHRYLEQEAVGKGSVTGARGTPQGTGGREWRSPFASPTPPGGGLRVEQANARLQPWHLHFRAGPPQRSPGTLAAVVDSGR